MIPFCFLAMVPAGFAEAPKLSCDEVRQAQLEREPGLLIIDVRPPADYAAGHIQGAKNIPAYELGSLAVPRDGKVVVYCPDPSCPSDTTAADKLAGMGYSNVSVLEGGLAAWSKKGYPVERPKTVAKGPRQMPASEAKRKLDGGKILVLDVRPAPEFAAGHIPSARNLPLENLGAAPSIPKDRPVLVYDRVSARSRKAAEKLLEAGYEASELSGGLAGWAAMKYPVEVK